jgi:small subunit ribosomal protein S20
MRSAMRTQVKNVIKAVEAGDKASAESAYKAAVPALDRVVGKGIIKNNKAARHKSRLNARVKAMS